MNDIPSTNPIPELKNNTLQRRRSYQRGEIDVQSKIQRKDFSTE
jgi:hypothetical protein